MKRLFLLAAPVALLAAAACKDDPAGPEPIASVTLAPEERVLAVGQTLQLDPAVRDTRGETRADEDVELSWTSDNPSVATVSGTGLVTAVSPGNAVIRATVDDVTGSVTVRVAAAPPECNQAGAVRNLAVGESVTLGGITASVLCLGGGGAGSEFVMVPFNAAGVGGGVLPVGVTTAGTIPVLATSPSVSAADAALQVDLRAPTRDFGWEDRFRREAARELAPWVATARDVAAAARSGGGLRPAFALNTRDAQVGDQLRINVKVEGCEAPDLRTGRVKAVTPRAIVVADEANPAGGLTDAEYVALGQAFDQLVYPTDVAAFGEPGDLDRNGGRAVIFYTRAVNELTPPGSGTYIGGFFHPRDLFPNRDRGNLEACEGSNYAEMFYMLVPDPSGTVNNNPRSRALVLGTTVATLAHEFQHLINASRRLYQQETLNWNEELWLNEGLSHVAEELVFYTAAGIGPRQNVSNATRQASARVNDAFNVYMVQNAQRYDVYLRSPEVQSPYDNDDDLGTRGAAWSFLRYAADRKGGDENAFWRSMVDNGALGLDNLQGVLGADPRLWVRDWTVSVFTDDAVSNLDARFVQPSWNWRGIFTTYPLQTRRLGVNGGASLALSAGSGAFVRFGVAPAATATVRTTAGGTAVPPSELFVTVVRTR